MVNEEVIQNIFWCVKKEMEESHTWQTWETVVIVIVVIVVLVVIGIVIWMAVYKSGNCTQLSTPTNLTATFATSPANAVQLNWTAVSSANSYAISYSAPSISTTSSVLLGNSSTASYLAQNLPMSNIYTFYVVAVNGTCNSTPATVTINH